MLPWFLVTGLGGLILGLVFGVLLASALVRGHYTHIMTNQQEASPPPLVQRPVVRRQRGRSRDIDGYYE
jgi:hypothetical protein